MVLKHKRLPLLQSLSLFDPLPKLKVLDLSGSLKTVPIETIGYFFESLSDLFPSLEELILSHNFYAYISDEWISFPFEKIPYMSRLKVLELVNTRLGLENSNLPPHFFDDTFPAIQTLNLAHNGSKVTSYKAPATLSTLNISYCCVRQIPLDYILNMPSLAYLHLSGNPLIDFSFLNEAARLHLSQYWINESVQRLSDRASLFALDERETQPAGGLMVFLDHIQPRPFLQGVKGFTVHKFYKEFPLDREGAPIQETKNEQLQILKELHYQFPEAFCNELLARVKQKYREWKSNSGEPPFVDESIVQLAIDAAHLTLQAKLSCFSPAVVRYKNKERENCKRGF